MFQQRTKDIIQRDLKLTRDEDFCFGGKIVRGAYMDEVRIVVCSTRPSGFN